MGLIFSFVVSLTLTLILELSLALLWHVEQSDWLAVTLANLLTNPIVVLCYYAAAWHTPRLLPAITLLLELSAITAEGLIYARRSQISHPWTFSLCANVLSFLTGLLL